MLKKLFVRLHLRKETFAFQPFIYLDKNGNPKQPGEMSSTIRWLDDIFFIKGYSDKKATKKAFEIVNTKFPEYKGNILLF
jgi:hypothetical protein